MVAGIEFLLRSDVTVMALAVVLVTAVAVVYRRVVPLVSMAAVFVAATSVDLYQLATQDFATEDLGASVFMLILPYNLFRWGSAREVLGGLVIAASSFGLGVVSDDLSVSEAIGALAVLTVSFGLGLTQRMRARNRAQKIENVKSRERERIARDLHDTVAHHVSGIAIRAQAGLALGERDRAAATDALRVIAAEASKTLDEMRSMVGTLRGDASAEYRPHTGLDALLSLADRDASVPVRLETVGSFDDVADGVGGALYRIAQEAITNARLHGRGATGIDVRAEALDDSVRLEVSNDGRPFSRSSSDSGYGLIGMRERAELLGGSLQAEPRADGGWRVTAILPKRGPAS
jgi:signal transduction histidine kinase